MQKKYSNRFYSNKQEKKVAKVIQGKQQSNSGATAFNKGDVVNDDWLIECKTVIKDQKSFTIKKKWIEKNKEEAFAMNKMYSALAFSFGENEPNYYVINEKDFRRLLNYERTT